MLTVDIHEAEAHLSRLVEQAAQGEPFVIAKAGKPLVKVTAARDCFAGTGSACGFPEGPDPRTPRF